jgi:hypothetical protein
MTSSAQTSQVSTVQQTAPVAQNKGAVVSNIAPVKKESMEDKTINEHAEYFTSCGGNQAVAYSSDPCASDLEYAVHEYGGVGLDFKDWATAQSVDPSIIRNHKDFVKDRLANNTVNITGRTYSPDAHESYNEIPWQGIRGRPEAVAICNPQNMPEANQAVYASKPRLTWDSS